MWIYLKLAWRNLLRNKRRSLIAGTAIGLGLASLIFTDALVIGMEDNMVESATSTYLGEGRIEREGFPITHDVDLTVNRLDWVVSNLGREPILKNFTLRVLSFAMITSPANVSSIELVGVDPKTEREVTRIDDAIVEGAYFQGSGERDIVIGAELADLLDVVLGDRVVVTVAQAKTGQLSQELFRISGIYRFRIRELDRGLAFVRIGKAQQMMALDGRVHEIALEFIDASYGSNPSLPFWRKYSRFGNRAVGWPVILPQVQAAFRLSEFSTYLVGVVLFAVVALIIVNTLFMSLHERMFEFGVLRAVGTRPLGVFQLITYEAGVLSVWSILLGSALGLGVTYLTSRIGIDYSGIEFAGVTFIGLLRPVLRARQFWEYPLWVFVFTVLIGMYPAAHAARISPAGAMRRSL